MHPRSLVAATAATVLAIVAIAAAANAAPAHTWPVVVQKLYMTGNPGSLPVAVDGGSSPLQLAPHLANSNSLALFVLPSVTLPIDLGIIGQQSQDWVGTVQQPFDTTVTQATSVDLYFVAQVEATSLFRVSLFGVAANGTTTLLGEQARQFVTVLSGAPEHFDLPTQGALLHAGDRVLLRVSAETLSAAVTLQFDSATSPSAIASLSLQVKDTDGDGIPDSVDPCPTVPDCNGNGVPDGNEPVNGTGQTYYQYYRNYYNSTMAGQQPGAPGAPGLPGSNAPAPGGSAAPPFGASPSLSTTGLHRIETTAGGISLATGTTITTFALLRRRP